MTRYELRAGFLKEPARSFFRHDPVRTFRRFLELVGEVAAYGDIYRYCYVRGPAGIFIGLVEELR